ncbi:hypothetical protein QTO34_010494 [Cnephaeus nilssonii]|uniref:Ig-like domain-containing protein n=1 Tax=Cnephaeus nilssonii TaxID=3371016 RepID=A0AA40HGJ6_CNENI|nr:hypothetical protein QTO34_010494 [Eptesicus nilssonii]
MWLFLGTWCTAPASAIQVTVSDPYHVVILFQPVTLPCSYQLTTTPTAPIVIWKYKSFCRDRVADAFSPASVDNQLNAQLAAGNPGYNPYVECQDSVRTVRVVATKQGNAVTLGDYYQGRRITITGNADLTFDQTAWGDSGVYYCSVVSAQDLQGNNEAYAELIVLGRTSGVAELLPGFQAGPMEDWLFVVVVCLAVFLVFLLLGICWCQCCPHTCCCYVRCPCCPDKCCCPEALYAAGKAATSGVPSIYAPSTYAYLSPAKTPPPAAMIPMGTVYNGYAGDFDKNSSGGCSSQVPLLRDADSSVTSEVRSGYRIQASQQDDSMRVLYYMEKNWPTLTLLDLGPPAAGPVESMSHEVTSLHEDDWRSRPSRGPALPPVMDEEWGRHSPRRRRSPPNSGKRGRAYAHPRSRSPEAQEARAAPVSPPRGRPWGGGADGGGYRQRDIPRSPDLDHDHRPELAGRRKIDGTRTPRDERRRAQHNEGPDSRAWTPRIPGHFLSLILKGSGSEQDGAGIFSPPPFPPPPNPLPSCVRSRGCRHRRILLCRARLRTVALEGHNHCHHLPVSITCSSGWV